MNQLPDDSTLLQQFRNEATRQTAFRSIIQKYQKRIYWHIRKMVIDHDDADDLTQDTFIKAWAALENFRNDSGLFTWLYRIATNETLSFLRKKKTRNQVSLDDEELDLSPVLKASTYFDGDKLQMKLQLAILTLPEKQRLVFNMKYFDNLKYEEMAQILETSVGALKANYHHAVKKIETYFASN